MSCFHRRRHYYYHHRHHHLSIVSLHRHQHHDHISTCFPPPPLSHYLPHIDSILAGHRPPHQPYIDLKIKREGGGGGKTLQRVIELIIFCHG